MTKQDREISKKKLGYISRAIGREITLKEEGEKRKRYLIVLKKRKGKGYGWLGGPMTSREVTIAIDYMYEVMGLFFRGSVRHQLASILDLSKL